MTGDEQLGLPWIVILGFLRIATNSKIFPQPLAPNKAIEKIDTWLALGNTRLVREKEDHWLILRSLLEDVGTAGNLTTDRSFSVSGDRSRCCTRFLRQ